MSIHRKFSLSQSSIRQILTLLVCIAASVVVSVVPLFEKALPAIQYVQLHTVIELLSIAVSLSVFAVGWYSYKQTQNRQDIIVAAIYLTIGMIDTVHTLSYKGMPNFLGENTPGKAAAYWLIARFLDGAALFGAAFIRPSKEGARRAAGLTIAAPFIVMLISVALVTRYEHAIGHALFLPDKGLTPLKIGIEYFIILLYAAAFIAFGRTRRWTPESTEYLQIALVINIFAELAFTRYISPFDGFNLLGHIFKAMANYAVLRSLFVMSLQQPFKELKVERDVLKRLQQSFLPKDEPAPQGYQIAKTYEPVESGRHTGGDFYDDFTLPDGRRAVMICDVSGKGLGATANAVTVKQTLRAYALQDPDPVSVMSKLNEVMCRDLSDGLFVTAFYGVIDPADGRMIYVNAGHEQPIYVNRNEIIVLDSTGPILGISPTLPFEQGEYNLEPGSVFVLVTDGITESRKDKEGMLGVEGLANLVRSCASLHASDIIDHIFYTLHHERELRDDAVMIVIKREA